MIVTVSNRNCILLAAIEPLGVSPDRKLMSDKKVQCVPGGHQISLDKAYWCNQCEQYVCYDHARKSVMVNTMKCPKGHEITKAG
jgi:hypothetical protein